MRIFQPTNEFGQALLNEGQLVATSQVLTKNLVDGAIVLNEGDIPNIDSWSVKTTMVTIGAQTMTFQPEISRGGGAITVRFFTKGEPVDGLTSATLTLVLNDASGFLGEQVEVSIEVRIEEAIASGDKAKIQALGAELQETGLPEYKYAGCKTIQELLKADGATSGYGAQVQESKVVEDENGNGYVWAEEGAVDVNLMSFEGDNETSFMFNNVTHFTGNLASLQTAQCSLFAGGPIVTFESDMPCLTDGSRMFYNCMDLEFFTGALPVLDSGYEMFSSCSNLTSWTVDLPKLTNGYHMFYQCYNLTSWTVDLPKLTNGESMFYRSGLTSWNVDLSSLTNGEDMFYRSGLTSFNGDLSSLTDGIYMFKYCMDLTTFNGDLHALINGDSMFQYCTNLTSFKGDLSSLTNGNAMFYHCDKLRSFTGDLSELKNGDHMFSDCKVLASFYPFEENDSNVTEGKLTNGYHMFHQCYLNIASVERIAAWLPQRSRKVSVTTESSDEGWIHIGVRGGVKDSGQKWTDAINKMKAKYWSIVVCENGKWDSYIR